MNGDLRRLACSPERVAAHGCAGHDSPHAACICALVTESDAHCTRAEAAEAEVAWLRAEAESARRLYCSVNEAGGRERAALRAQVAALVWAVLDERRMKALHRAALREEISAAVFDTDSDRENAAMAESRETASAAGEATTRLDDLLRGGAPTGVIPAEAAQVYLDALAAWEAARAAPCDAAQTVDEVRARVAAVSAAVDRCVATRAGLVAALLAAAGGA